MSAPVPVARTARTMSQLITVRPTGTLMLTYCESSREATVRTRITSAFLACALNTANLPTSRSLVSSLVTRSASRAGESV